MTSPGLIVAGRYHLQTLSTRTSGSELWLALDQVAGQYVYVELHPVRTPEQAAAFTRNAAVLATLSHPALPTVADHGVDPAVGGYLLLHPTEDAAPIEERLGQLGYLSDGHAAGVLAAIAGGLAAAHGRGLVHGSLSPQCVREHPGVTWIFGFDLTGSGQRDSYTLRYAAPEVRQGGAPTPASDVWSLGVVAYELLTTETPGYYPVDVPSRIDRELAGLITRALAQTPGDRITATEFAATADAARQRLDIPYAFGGGAVPAQPQAADEWAIEQELPMDRGFGALPDLGARPVPAAPPPPPAQAPAAPGGVPEPRAERSAPPPKRAQAPATAVRLEFAAAYREAIEVARAYPVLFFVHGPDDWPRVQEIIDRRRDVLGAPAVSRSVASKDVRSGTILTVVPTVLGATFEPARVEVVAGGDLRELTFQMTAGRTGAIDGYIDVFVGPLVIAQVPVSFQVTQPATVPTQQPGAELMKVANATIFDSIFVSYSHKDSDVVDLCVATYQGLGVEVLVDKHELRSGEDWRAALQRLIERADIFQLYWSRAAAASQEVAHEWRQALTLSQTRYRFIRPLYWETPLPPAPEPLDRLHFSKIDIKALRRAAKAYLPAKPGLLRRILGR